MGDLVCGEFQRGSQNEAALAPLPLRNGLQFPSFMRDLPPCILIEKGPNSSNMKNFSSGASPDRIAVIVSSFLRYLGSLLVKTFLAFRIRNPASLMILDTTSLHIRNPV